MFSRIRHRTASVPERRSWVRSALTVYHGDPDYCYNHSVRTDSPLVTDIVSRLADDTISDMGRNSRSRKKLKVSPRNPLIPRPTKPVNHVKVRVSPREDPTYFERSLSGSAGACDVTSTLSEETTPAAWLCERFGKSFVEDYIVSKIPNMALFTFNRPDWFALVDRFKESVDSLVPDKFFLGEDLAESGIFGDALRLVLHPRKNLLHFFRHVVDSGLKHKTLGEIDKTFRHSIYGRKLLETRSIRSGLEVIPASLKDAVDAHLLYKFGVAPAIQDLVSMFNVHKTVLGRLKYLVKNEGRYVPIRVRQVLPVAFDSSYPPTPYVDMVFRQSAQHTVATIFAQGKVRGDLNAASGFRAYAEYFGLNKIVGTAWELIPFTFVFDWVTNAQERINDLTRVRLGESTFYNLVGIGSSTKDILRHEVLLTPGYDLTWGMPLTSPNTPTVAYEIESSIYSRVPGIPDTSGVVDISTLGSFQGITGVELLLQK